MDQQEAIMIDYEKNIQKCLDLLLKKQKKKKKKEKKNHLEEF